MCTPVSILKTQHQAIAVPKILDLGHPSPGVLSTLWHKLAWQSFILRVDTRAVTRVRKPVGRRSFLSEHLENRRQVVVCFLWSDLSTSDKFCHFTQANLLPQSCCHLPQSLPQRDSVFNVPGTESAKCTFCSEALIREGTWSSSVCTSCHRNTGSWIIATGYKARNPTAHKTKQHKRGTKSSKHTFELSNRSSTARFCPVSGLEPALHSRKVSARTWTRGSPFSHPDFTTTITCTTLLHGQ